MVRTWEDAGQLTVPDGPLPMLSEVGFHDHEGLAQRVRKYAASSILRNAVSASQRRSVAGRLTYDAGIRRVVGRIRELLEEAATAGEAVAATRATRAEAA
jgi:hypothetical protein